MFILINGNISFEFKFELYYIVMIIKLCCSIKLFHVLLFSEIVFPYVMLRRVFPFCYRAT